MVARPAPTLVARSWDAVACRLVAEGRPLRVHSTFERALNLQTVAGELLGLVGPRAGNGPSTIVLDRLPPVGLDRAGIAPGAPARGTDAELRIATQLTVDLRMARLWLPPSTRPAVSPWVALTRVERAEAAARAAAPAGGLAPLLPHLATLADRSSLPASPAELDPLGRAAWSALSALLPAWRGDDSEAVETAATRLVGLGPGLTPSGDDLLAGLLVATDRTVPTSRFGSAVSTDLGVAGARSAGACPPPIGAEACASGRSWKITIRDAVVAAAIGRTTDVAVARVRHAARGAIEEVQEHVLTSLLGANDAGLVPAVERAARWGHTSGVDTLVGLFLGLRLSLGASSKPAAARPIVRAEMLPR